MGIAAGDYENNGHLSIVNTDFADDYNVLFQNDGTGYLHRCQLPGRNRAVLHPLCQFRRRISRLRQRRMERSAHRQRPRLSARWTSIRSGAAAMRSARCSITTWGMASSSWCPRSEGTGLAVVTVGRGAAFGDIFNDGKIDVVINSMDGVPILLRNVNPDHHHWVELKLVGGPKSPRDAVGATVYLNGERDAPAGRRFERRQLSFVERLARSLRLRRCDRCRNSGDSLAIGQERESEAARGGSHLHGHRRAGNYWRAVRRRALCGSRLPPRQRRAAALPVKPGIRPGAPRSFRSVPAVEPGIDSTPCPGRSLGRQGRRRRGSRSCPRCARGAISPWIADIADSQSA